MSGEIYRILIFERNFTTMTERELLKLEGTIKKKMEDIRAKRVTLKDSGIGVLINSLKKADEAAYEKLMPEYKKMLADIK